MNFINRAIKNVTRKYSKSILLILTFFLIGNLVIVGLGVSNASNSAKILTRKKMRAVVTYMVDYEKVWSYMDTIEDDDERQKFYDDYPRVKLEDVKEFLADSRVKTANALTSYTWYSDQNNSLDFVHLNNKREDEMSSGEGNSEQCYTDETGATACETYKEPYFMIKCNMFPGMIEFEDSGYKIKEGRFYNQGEIDEGSPICLISENLAATNGLSVGDTITLGINYPSLQTQRIGLTSDDLDYSFEIIGIYSHNSPLTPDSSNYDWASPYMNPDNMIFMPTTSAYMAELNYNQKLFDYRAATIQDEEYYMNEENRPSEENMMKQINIENATLLLNDPLDVEKFVEDYSDDLSQFVTLDANNEEFKKLAKPLDTLSMYANFIVWLVIINAVVIISLVTALTLKTREYEIGVLLSIGASKIKVIAQFFIELALVAVIGFSLAVISGSLISKKVGAKVLEYQIATSDITEEENSSFIYYDPWASDYATDISLDDLVAEYEVTISPMIIAEIYIMGLGIVLISVIIPSFMIMRYNPKKILMNTN